VLYGQSVPYQKTISLPLVLTLGALLLLAHIAYFYPFMADDAFISLRYAQRLLEGKGLTWNDGERVEGYSNILWVLLNAGLGALGMPLVSAVRLLGIGSAVLTLPVLALHAREAKLPPLSIVAGVVAFAIASPVAIWAMSGMETPMVMLLFTFAAVLSYGLIRVPDVKRAGFIGLLLGLICLLRPEGPLYVIAVAIGVMSCSVLPRAQRFVVTAFLCAVPFVFWAMQLCFRLYYYGQWFANTVMAKVAFTPERLENGFVYIVHALYFFLPLLLYAIINYRLAAKKNGDDAVLVRFGVFLFAVCGVVTAAIFVEGGDFFPCYRAFIPLFPLVVLMLMHAIAFGMKYAPIKKEMIFLGYIFACHVWMQYDMDANQSPKTNYWIESAEEMGLALKGLYGKKQPLIAVFAAGAIPYYSELPSLDVFGLNDVYLTMHRREESNFGKGIIGHELFDGRYIDSKKPDILVFDIPTFYPLCSGFKKECENLLPHYRPATLHIPGHDVRIWLRKDSSKVN
jgi:hypothetical protein